MGPRDWRSERMKIRLLLVLRKLRIKISVKIRI